MTAPRRASLLPAWVLVLAGIGLPQSAGALTSPWIYRSPTPGAQRVSPHHNVVVRADRDLDPSSVTPGTIAVVGDASGVHDGRITLAADGRTIVLVPSRPFALGERVRVDVAALRSRSGERLGATTFGFDVGVVDPRRQPRVPRDETADLDARASTPAAAAPETRTRTDALPATYPPIVFEIRDDPEPGHVFMTPNPPGAAGYGNLVIVDNTNRPIFYRKLPFARAADFRRQPGGLLTYFDYDAQKYYGMDSTYTVVDSFAVGNGYVTDLHELVVLPNGHAVMMAYDPQPVGMDTVVAGGNPNATVIGLIIQEIDAGKNVVFEWRSWDHFAITDADDCTVNLLGATIDYAHGNAIEVDHDGHFMISSRHLNEITKIDRQTGAIRWRLGLNAVNNQFAFVNDARGFSHQHDIRRLPNGNVTLFDNGNCLAPEYSRALEYALDETNKIATLVWEYRNTPDIYGRATGNVQRRASGGTMVNWGFGLRVTDLHPDDTKSLEITFGTPGMQTYRALRFPWRTTRFESDVASLDFGTVAIGATATRTLEFRNDLAAPIEIDELEAVGNYSWEPLTATPFTIPGGGSRTVSVRFVPNHPGAWNGTLYARAIDSTEVIAQTVALTGTATGTAASGSGPPAAFVLEPVRSPSRGAVEIGYAIPWSAARVRLAVLDVQGRVVDVLADGEVGGGRRRATWGSGRAPGLYFVRFEWPGGSAVRRFAWLE